MARRNNELANRLRSTINTLGKAAYDKGIKEQLPQVKELPKLNGMGESRNKSYVDTDRARRKYAERDAGPATKYNYAGQTTSPNINPNRDKTFDKDFDEFYNWRYDKQDVRDYDPNTDTETEHWRNVKQDLMKKNGWTEQQFDAKFNEYYDERRQKESDAEVAGWTRFAEEHPRLASVGQTILNPGTWMEGAVTAAEGPLSLILPEEVKEKYIPSDPNDYRLEHTRVREAVKNTAKEKIGGGMLYDMGVGLLDLPGGAFGMAANNAASTQRRKLANGSSRDKAAQTGAVGGLISYITNKFGLGKVASGNLGETAWQAIRNGALIEGAENIVENRLNHLADVLINQKNSDIAQIYQHYVEQGKSPAAAAALTFKDLGVEDATAFGTGALMGGTMRAMNNIPELSNLVANKWAENQTLNIADPTIRDIVAGAMEGATRKVPALEGEELAAAQKKIDNNKIEINTLKAKKQAILDDTANWRNNKLTKAAEAQIKEIDGQIAGFQNDSKLTRRQIKGTPTPVKEMLAPEDYDAIYNGRTGIAADLDYAVRFAGNTDEAKAIRKEAKNLLNNYIKSNDVADLRAFLKKVTELDQLARRTNAVYQSKAGKTTYAEHFGVDENDPDFPMVVSSVINTKGLVEGVPAAHERYNAQFGPEVAEEGAPIQETEPTQEIPSEPTDGGFQNMNRLFEQANQQNQAEVPEVTQEQIPNEPIQPTNDVPNMDGMTPGDNGGNNVPPPESPISSEPPRTDNMRQSDVGRNSAVNAGIYTREQLDNDPILHELNSYAKANNDLTYNQAKEDVISDGATLLDEYSTGKRAIANDIDVDRSMILLTDLTRRIEAGETGLEAQKNLLFSRLRQAGTKYGQAIQAFAKWNQTPEGAIINAERIHKAPVEKWKDNNQTKVQANSRIAKALERMGYDGSMDKAKTPLTHDQIREGVIKVIEKEYGSIEGIFNDNDIEFLTYLAENREIPIWQITDEIEHRLNYGEWYTLDESIPEPKKGNQKLQKALNDLLEREPAPEKEPLSFDELKQQIRNTLDNEYASAGTSRLYTDQGEFTDADVEYLAHMIQNGATGAELSEALDTKLATGTFGISAETQAKVNQLFEYADHYDPNSKEACEAMAAAYKLLADEVVGDATPFEKFEAWRYLAMLGNPKTMFRNFIGNNIFSAVTGVSNNLSALFEAGTDKLVRQITNGQKGIQRTKSVLNPVKDKGLIDASGRDLEEHRYRQAQGSKYEKGVKDAIKSSKSVFNSRWAQIYENLTDRGISDYGAVKRKYSTSLAGWMKANGLDETAFDADAYYRNLQKESRYRVLSDTERAQMESYKQIADMLEKGRDYAMEQAEYATFHEDNAVAKMLTKWSMGARNSDSSIVRALGYMGEGLVPFKKTPANVLRSGVEYSPLNVINSIRETGKFIIENTGRRKNDLADTYTKTNKITGREKTIDRTLAADVLDSWSKTLTGTALAGLGYFLFNKGVLHSSEDGEKYQDQLEGKQNYSIIINGHSYTIDWASPAAMPLLMGAELNKLWTKLNQPDEKFYNNIDDVLGAVSALLDPVFETSMLQGIQNTAESVAHEITYGNSGMSKGLGIFGAIAGNTLTNYASQGIPTILGQVARTVDPVRRTTDTANEGFLGSVERVGRKQMNKIPFLSKLNQPYYDAYARQQKNSPFENPLGNLAYQMLSPGYYDKVDETAADKSARSVYNRRDEKLRPVKNDKVFPELKSVVRIDGEKLNPEQKAQYNVKAGTAQKMIRNALANQKWFKELPGAEKEEILTKVNSIADKVGKAQFAEQTGTEYEKYKEGGIQGLLEYFRGKSAKNQVEQQTGLSSQSNASKAIVEQVEKGNKEVAQQMMKDAKTIADYGLTKPGPTETFQKAQKAAAKNGENLSVDDFAKTYKAIDADHNQGIKQDELIDYFNKKKLPEAEGLKLWDMYAPKGKKVPYLKKDGTWGKH